MFFFLLLYYPTNIYFRSTYEWRNEDVRRSREGIDGGLETRLSHLGPQVVFYLFILIT